MIGLTITVRRLADRRFGWSWRAVLAYANGTGVIATYGGSAWTKAGAYRSARSAAAAHLERMP